MLESIFSIHLHMIKKVCLHLPYHLSNLTQLNLLHSFPPPLSHNLLSLLNQLGGTPAFGITKYSDWSREEIKQYLLPGVRFPHDHGITKEKIIRSTKNNPVKGSGTSPSSLSTGVPVDLDWRDKGAVTPVRNQGLKCGSCWAHSASQTVESLWYLAGKGLPSLSVQQLVSCDSDDEACRGGFPISAYRYISKAGGLEGESTYPYVSGMGDVPPCAFNKSNVVAKINGFSWAESDGNEKNLIKILSDVGPLSVCVDAHNWPDYKSGVITTCGSWIDHCVQLVGYKNYTSAVDTILQSSLSSASSSSPNDMTVTTSSTTPSATPSSTAAGNPYYIIRNSWDSTLRYCIYVFII